MQISDAVPFDGYKLIDTSAQINESFKDEMEKSHGAIIGVVEGKHFCPGGTSRNHRWYPPELWLAVGQNEAVQARLKRNGIVGRVGHEPEITDEDIGEGNYSHFTKDIDWKTGFARSFIVDTPMGRNLLTALRARIGLYVSSRATGDYSGKTESGDDIMDTKTYDFERFDFVQDPGFLEAKPSLVTESFNKTAVNGKIAETLLRIAKKVGATLSLDGRKYVVESVGAKGIEMSTADTHLKEMYESSAFEDVLPELEEAIVKSANNEALTNDLKIARFANEQGLDESYVRDRLDAGASFEQIAHEHVPAGQTYRIAETQVVHRPKHESVLNRIFR